MKRNIRGPLLLIVVAAGFVVLLGSREILSFIAEWLFFREVRFEQVFLKTLAVNVGTGVAFGVTTFLMLFINLRIAASRHFPNAGIDQLRNTIPALQRIDLDRILRWAGIIVAGFGTMVAFTVGVLKGQETLLFLLQLLNALSAALDGF